MKTRYKILIIGLTVFCIYWPGIPLVALTCQQITDDKICFDIARLRITIPASNDVFKEINPNIRIDDSAFARQSLQTGETITFEGHLVSITIKSLGAVLIVLFIVIYTIKKKAKGVSKFDSN